VSSIRYRPEIDGLRALAVLPVILFHLGARWIPGGFLGVDVFFVISGYLITSIILADYERGAFSFAGFWLRRVRRIVPVLVAMVAATLVAGRFLLYSPDIAAAGRQGVAALLSLSNINFWRDPGGYWGAQARDSLFLHTWSLSAEEQFYLVFPLLLFVALRYLNKHLAPVALLLTASSLLLYCYAAFRHPSAAFYLLPTRAWELGVGCTLAVLNRRHPTMLRNGTGPSLAGLLAIAIAYAAAQGDSGFSPLLIASAVGAGLVIAFARDERNAVNRALSSPPLVYIGKLSYSLYLWHWPVMVFWRQIPATGHAAPPAAFSLPLVFVLAVLSYHVIERRTRNNPKAVPWILAAFLVTLVYAGYLAVADLREDISRFGRTSWAGELYNVRPERRQGSGTGPRDGIAIDVPAAVDPRAFATGGIVHPYGGPTPEIVLLGDSHALMWAGVLDDIARELGVSISHWAAYGTSPFMAIPPRKEKARPDATFNADEKLAFDAGRVQCLTAWKPRVVVIASQWSARHDEDPGDLMRLLEGIGSAVLLLEQPPELFFGDKSAPRYLSFMGLEPDGTRRYLPRLEREEYRMGRALLRGIAAAYPRCSVVPVADLFLNGPSAWVLDGPDVLYTDDDHLSTQGALRARPMLLRELRNRLSGWESAPAGSPSAVSGR
jgi:peptidoglycan/LPS O-acetylase OafA/YrhL